MEGYILRKGDMITVGANSGFITKTTPKYVYYFMKGYIARAKKSTIWEHYDTKDSVSLSYGSKNRRRQQRRMRSLDLHGTKHLDVEEEVKSFLNFVKLPCKIITGNSDQMKYLVNRVVQEYGWDCHIENEYNPGTLVVVEK